MKRSKILFPALSALAVTPAIALVGCNQGNSEEQNILDAIFNPMDLTKSQMPKSTFVESYNAMSDEDKQKELIYDLFGDFNYMFLDDSEDVSVGTLYRKKNEGAFKINLPYLNIKKNSDCYYASARGYVSYVFEKEHTFEPVAAKKITFKANDFVMITYNFTDLKIEPHESLGFIGQPEFGCIGMIHYKYDGNTKEALEQKQCLDTTQWTVKNSKNWIK